MLTKFDEQAQKAIVVGESIAFDLGHNNVGSEHLLLSLLKISNSKLKELVKKYNVDDKNIYEYIKRLFGKNDDQPFYMEYSEAVKGILERAIEITNEQNKITKLAAEKFISDFKNFKNGIIFEGESGTGKTHISMAICNELLKENTPIIFGTLTELVDKYAKFYTNHAESELTKLYTKVDLLVIDNLGLEPMNDWLLSKLFTIINERILNELPYIITTNYNMETLKERLSIPNKVCETPNSIISRLSNMCYRIQCK